VNITVDLKDRSYDVVVDEGARDHLADLLARRAPHAKCAVVVTSTSLEAQPWFDLSSGVDQFTVVVPEGESAKTIGSYERLLDSLAEHRLSRDDVVVGVGGGAITDLAGFAAATFLRGVALIQVPTSLVAQVDAAIGGKTGINIPAGKNLVGAFHQPLGVLCDTSVLSTLPERERKNGLGEVAKCWLLEGRTAADVAATPLTDLIELSVQLKATIVASDEREGNARVLLNYGHTLAHALEAVVLGENSDEMRHGEAVAVGLAFAARLARSLGRVDDDVVATHDAVLDGFGLHWRLGDHFDVDTLIDFMTHDKKARHDLSFVLDGPQGFELVRGVEPSVVRSTLDLFKGES
jgi:5-deoxy-5-amino-3-dehydroquinate synthase